MVSIISSQQAAVSPVFNYLFIILPVSVYHPVPKLMAHVSSLHFVFLLSFVMAALGLRYRFCISFLFLPSSSSLAESVTVLFMIPHFGWAWLGRFLVLGGLRRWLGHLLSCLTGARECL